jgi:hypothetical protein
MKVVSEFSWGGKWRGQWIQNLRKLQQVIVPEWQVPRGLSFRKQGSIKEFGNGARMARSKRIIFYENGTKMSKKKAGL